MWRKERSAFKTQAGNLKTRQRCARKSERAGECVVVRLTLILALATSRVRQTGRSNER